MTTSLLLLALATAPPAEPAPQGVLLDFTATWCGPCQQMSPIVSKLEREGQPVRRVDVNRQPDLVRQYKVQSIPAFVLIVNGREADRIVGATTEQTLRKLLARIPTAAPPEAIATNAAAPSTAPVQSRQDGPARTLVAGNDGTSPRSAATPTHPIPFSRPAESATHAAPVVRANLEGTANSARPIVGTAEWATDPLDGSVRIRVKDRQGVNFGSGTIVESRIGRTTVLTCGHVFRNMDDQSLIEVDVFDGSRSETYLGKVLKYDLEADVGAIVIPTTETLPVVRIAAKSTKVATGAHVFSVGCSGGETPTKQQLLVTALNRYIGPDNLECTGVPVQGRSGGGLFDAQGRVIGVCVAADPRDKRGLYAGLKAIWTLLGSCDVTVPGAAEESPAESATAPAAVASVPHPDDALFEPQPQPPRTTPERSAPTRTVSKDVAATPTAAATLRDEDPNAERARLVAQAMEQAGEAEVICIIRPHGDPRATSRVVIINRASGKFVSYLTGEMESQPELTSSRKVVAGDDAATESATDRFLTPFASSIPSSSKDVANASNGANRPSVLDRPDVPARATGVAPPVGDRPTVAPNGDWSMPDATPTPQRYRRNAASR